MDAVILSDDIDCPEMLTSLTFELLQYKLKPKIILREHFKTLVEESKHLPPFLFFNESSCRIENFKVVLDFHQKTSDFAIVEDKSGNILSINPALVDICNGEPIIRDTVKKFTASNANLSRHLLPVSPPQIVLMSHSRDVYLELTVNSLLHSLQPHIEKVPIIIALSEPTAKVVECAKKFQKNYPHIEVLEIKENTHMATPLFILKYLELRNRYPETFMIMEDDFILPSSIKDIYPAWPWLFANRLKIHDMVGWLPSLDNFPTTVSKYVNFHGIKISRNFTPGCRWVNSGNNYNLAMSGNAVACKTTFYQLCSMRSQLGFPMDTELRALAPNISAPVIPGYHIGWNQVQDGHPKLDNRPWPGVLTTAHFTDCRKNESFTVTL